MEENKIFQENPENFNVPGRKPTHTPSLVLGILSIVFSLLIALIGDILAIIGIIMAVRKRKDYNTKAALICSIIGLVLSIGNHIFAILIMAMAFAA